MLMFLLHLIVVGFTISCKNLRSCFSFSTTSSVEKSSKYVFPNSSSPSASMSTSKLSSSTFSGSSNRNLTVLSFPALKSKSSASSSRSLPSSMLSIVVLRLILSMSMPWLLLNKFVTSTSSSRVEPGFAFLDISPFSRAVVFLPSTSALTFVIASPVWFSSAVQVLEVEQACPLGQSEFERHCTQLPLKQNTVEPEQVMFVNPYEH